MSIAVRRLTEDDRTVAWKLGSLAFGYHDRDLPASWTPNAPGQQSWGAFDTDGTLFAKAVDRDQGQWFGGQLVPTCGIAGVAVAPQARSQGLMRQVLTHLLEGARDRGAVISTLFPTTPWPYRSLGWEEVGALVYQAFPALALANATKAPSVALRAATEEDVPRLAAIYRSVAQAGTGMMDRSGPTFPSTPAEFLAPFDGVTIALGAQGEIEGYATWRRGAGYDANSTVTIDDLVTLTPAAAKALMTNAGSWASVAPTILVRLTHPDPAMTVLASTQATTHSRQPWMLRAVDVVGAIAARGWPSYLHGSVDLELEDETCPWNAGAFRLTLADGKGHLEPGGSGHVRLTARGWALWYSGAASPDLLRRSGLLTGGTPDTDAFLQAATAGPPPNLLDYF